MHEAFRKAYSEATYRQTTEDFIGCLENAFASFGGCPKVLVIDNLRAAVTYDDKKDRRARLNRQLRKVFDLMKDGEFRTLDGISAATGASSASVSACLRDLRKTKHGSHTVERKSLGRGLFEYRLLVNPHPAVQV